MRKIFLQVYDNYYDVFSGQKYNITEILKNDEVGIFITDNIYKLEFITDEELYDSRNNIDMIDLPQYFAFENFENNRYISFNGKRINIPSITLIDNIKKKAELAKCNVKFLSLEKFLFDPLFQGKRDNKYEMYSKILFVFKIANFIFVFYSDISGELTKSFFKYEEDLNKNIGDLNTFVQTYIDSDSIASKEFACLTNIKELKSFSDFLIKKNIEFYDVNLKELTSTKIIERITYITIYDYLDQLCGNKLVKHIRYFSIILVFAVFYWFSAFTNVAIVTELNSENESLAVSVKEQKEKVEKIIQENNIKFIPLVYDYVHNNGKTYDIINSVFNIILVTISFNIEGYNLIGYDYDNSKKEMVIFFRRLPVYSVYTEDAFINEFEKLLKTNKYVYKIKDNILLDSSNQIIQFEVIFK